MVLVENKWFAGIISTPLYLVAFLTVSLVTVSALMYVIYGIAILYGCGIIYHHAVLGRVKRGCSQLAASCQWVVGQILFLGAWFATISALNIST